MSSISARLAADTLKVLPRKRLSRALGWAADLVGPDRLVQYAIQRFVRAYDVDLSEAEVPEGGFSSFNAFFTRALRPGARPVDSDPRVLVSPADGKMEGCGVIDLAATLTVKGKLYDVVELLDDPSAASRYEGGTYFVVYLSPRDYHRVHAPAAGPVERARYVPGTLFPVNEIGTGYIPRLFARNERVAMVQRSAHHGEVTTIMVGAIGVGKISLSFDDLRTNAGYEGGLREYGERSPLKHRGDELGVFHLGSTAVVLVTRDCPLQITAKPGDMVRVGTTIARGGVT